MNLRPLLLSVAVLAPLAAAVWWFQRPDLSPVAVDPRVGTRLADPEALTEASVVRISAQGKTLELRRGEGGRWTVVGDPVLPADAARLTRLTADLVSAKVERFVTANPDRLATLDLGSAIVAFLPAEGAAPLLELGLGKNADGGGRFVRFGAETRAYLSRLSVWLDAEPTSWRDNLLVRDVSTNEIAALRFEFPETNESVVVSREKADASWTSPATPAGSRVKASLLTSQTGNLTTLRFTGAAARQEPGVVAALAHPREVSLTTFDGRTVRITFYRVPPPPPAPPAEGEQTSPPASETPRPIYVQVADSREDAILAAAARTHIFEISEWIYTALPMTVADLFEPVPAPRAEVSASAAQPSSQVPVSVTTEPLTVEPPAMPASAVPKPEDASRDEAAD